MTDTDLITKEVLPLATNNDAMSIYNLLHGNEYNDQFNVANQYSMALFRPDAMVAQSDLNEEQSFLHSQFKLFGDYLLHNGEILSGMDLSISQPHSNKNHKSGNNQAARNLLNKADISAVNSVIDKDGYGSNGFVGVSSESETSDDYPGIELYINSIPQGTKYITVSFNLAQEVGELHNIAVDEPSGVTLVNRIVDGDEATGNEDFTSLGDGRPHNFQVTFNVSGRTTVPIYIYANNGYDMESAGNSVRYSISDLMVNTGEIAQGWKLSPDDGDTSTGAARNRIATVTNGTIYLDGYVREFYGGNTGNQINISGSGIERIGVKLTRRYVTDFYDTTKGAISQGERTADHIQYQVNLTYNDPTAVTIYTLNNGTLAENNASTGNSRLDALLAQRTYDQSGSFRVSGFDFNTTSDPNDSLKCNLNIDKGVAYVMGYGVYKTAPTTLHEMISRKEQTAIDEPVGNSYYNSNQDWVSTPLEHQPVVADSISVVGDAQVGGSNQDNPLLINSDSSSVLLGRNEETGQVDFTNDMEFDAQGGYLAKLPTVFQPQNDFNGQTRLAGGIVGSFTVYQPNSKGEIVNEVEYDDDNNTTKIIKSSDNKNLGTLTSGGFYQRVIDGIYYLGIDTDNEVGDQDVSLFDNELGSTLYIQGTANYAYKGPTDGKSQPDYFIKTSNSGLVTTQELSNGLNIGDKGLADAQLVFGATGTTGIRPPADMGDNDYSLLVTYKYYLAQVGVLTLDKNGQFGVQKGKPSPLGEAIPPQQIDPNVLRLGYIVFLPDTYRSNCQFSNVTRIPFSGLQDMSTEISNLQLELQDVLMEIQAKDNIDPTSINGSLNDDFTTFASADFSYNNDYNQVAYDLANGIISVPDKKSSIMALYPKLSDLPADAQPWSVKNKNGKINPSYPTQVNNTDSGDNYHLSDHLITASYNKIRPQEWQTNGNNTVEVNQITTNYVNGSSDGLLRITPNADDFVDCSNYVFSDGGSDSPQLHNWFTYDNHQYLDRNPFRNVLNSHSFGTAFKDNNVGTWSLLRNTGKQTASTGDEQLHRRKIYFSTDWLAPNSTGYRIFIDGKLDSNWYNPKSSEYIDLQADYSNQITSSQGMTYLSANNKGQLSGSFYLPNNLLTKAHKITLSNGEQNSLISGNPEVSTVSSTYYANGIKNDDKGAVERCYYAVDAREIDLPSVAQTVRLREDSTLTSVDLYFANKPSKNMDTGKESNVLVQLRTVDNNGYPTNLVIAQSTVPIRLIRTDGRPTHFVFSDPVFVSKNETIAITVYTKAGDTGKQSNHYLLEKSDTLSTDRSVLSTPNVRLFTSDGNNWDANPYNFGVLRFTLNRASFNPIGEIVFDPAYVPYNDSGVGKEVFHTVSKVALLADYITPDNTSVQWYLKIGYGKRGLSLKTNPNSILTKTYPINRRRTLTRITDSMTNSTNGHENQIYYFQLSCHFIYNQNDNTRDDSSSNAPTTRVSPMINYHTVCLAISEIMNDDVSADHLQAHDADWLKQNADGLYYTRSMTVKMPDFNSVITKFDAYEDDKCMVIPLFSVDNGQNWHFYNYNAKDISNVNNYQKNGLIMASPINDTFTRYIYKARIPGLSGKSNVDSQSNVNEFKMCLAFLSVSPYHQPMVKRLSNTLTTETGDENTNFAFNGDLNNDEPVDESKENLLNPDPSDLNLGD